MSDGPSNQYNKKSNFYLFTHLLSHLDLICAARNVSEVDHEKEAADDVGAVIKITTDFLVAYGKDIVDYSIFVIKVKNNL